MAKVGDRRQKEQTEVIFVGSFLLVKNKVVCYIKFNIVNGGGKNEVKL